METALIWLCGLACALLTMAVAAALAARVHRGLGVALLLLPGVGLAGSFALIALFATLERAQGLAVGAAAVFLAGTIWIAVAGRQSSGPGLPARAAEWPLP